MSKLILKNKKIYFNIFLNKKNLNHYYHRNIKKTLPATKKE